MTGGGERGEGRGEGRGERGGEGRGGEGRSGATTKENAHWELRENNNCASVLFYGNFFLISIEKKIANALRIKRERQKGKQLFSSLQEKKYSAEKRRPNRSQKCNHLR